jgi:hypothetical protein
MAAVPVDVAIDTNVEPKSNNISDSASLQPFLFCDDETLTTEQINIFMNVLHDFIISLVFRTRESSIPSRCFVKEFVNEISLHFEKSVDSGDDADHKCLPMLFKRFVSRIASKRVGYGEDSDDDLLLVLVSSLTDILNSPESYEIVKQNRYQRCVASILLSVLLCTKNHNGENDE